VENRAATRQTGIGARQQIDPDTLLERVVGPQPFHNHDPRLQPIKAAGVNDDTAAPVPDAHAVAIAQTELGEDRGMDKCRSPSHPADPSPVAPLDLERAGARAIMRADAWDDVEGQGSAPP
jgi:hypothetical protein